MGSPIQPWVHQVLWNPVPAIHILSYSLGTQNGEGLITSHLYTTKSTISEPIFCTSPYTSVLTRALCESFKTCPTSFIPGCPNKGCFKRPESHGPCICNLHTTPKPTKVLSFKQSKFTSACLSHKTYKLQLSLRDWEVNTQPAWLSG